MNKTRISLVAMVALISMAATYPAMAADGEWQLRLRGAWVSPDFSFQDIEDDDTRVRADSEDGYGYGLGLEYRVSDRVGIEVAALRSEPNVDLSLTAPWGETIQASSGLRSLMLSAGVNLHLTPDAPVDFYVGAMAAWIDYGDLRFSVEQGSVAFTVDDDLGWGATVGLDVPFADSGWSMNAAITYVDTAIDTTNIDEPETTPSLSYDTMVGTVGVGYRF